MPSSDHNSTQNQLAEGVPPATEAIGNIRQANTNADTSIGRDDLKKDVEDGIINWVALELRSFRDANEEDCKNNPPDIVSELTTKLLSYEVGPRFLTARAYSVMTAIIGVRRKDASDSGDGVAALYPASFLIYCGCHGGVRGRFGVISIDTKGALFVDVGIAHGNDNRINGNVHHYHVENEKSNTKIGDRNDIKAAGADGKGLKEAVKGSSAARKRCYG